jgi:spore coat polysaccharide biosynthesis predicted glycosyltransferase SpsG
VLVSFGRCDPQGLTLKVLQALDGLQERIEGLSVRVVLGPAFSFRSELEKLVHTMSLQPEVLDHGGNTAEMLIEADLVLCSGNLTVFEIAVLGTPGVVLSQNARQRHRVEAFAPAGSIANLGLGTEVEEATIRETARDLLENAEQRRSMSRAGLRLWEE